VTARPEPPKIPAYIITLELDELEAKALYRLLSDQGPAADIRSRNDRVYQIVPPLFDALYNSGLVD